jgi:beta-barrel assembly-enhancing protease
MSTPTEAAVYDGALSDGRTATATPVKLRLAADGIEIAVPEVQHCLVWPYADLRSGVPLRRNDREVLVHEAGSGAVLFVANASFSAHLIGRAPALSVVRTRLSGMRPGLAAVGLVAIAAGLLWEFDLHPSQAIARMLPQETREALGRNVIASFGDRKSCSTPAGRAALDRLTGRLAAAASERPMQVRVEVLDWGLVNAFAAPGGQLILTKGLLQAARSPDEVAGVLAHEMGHALELHPEAGLVRALGLAAGAQLVFAGSSGTVTNLGLLLTQLRYTRVSEREADLHAMRILKGAGISPKGLGDFFERVEGKPLPESVKRVVEFELIRTHPLTAERLALIRAQPAYAATAALSEQDWRALRDICPEAATPPPPPQPQPAERPDTTQADREIADASRTLEANPNDVAALQTRARAHAKKRQYDRALVDYSKASGLKPEDATLHAGRGQAHHGLSQYEDALRAYDEAIRLAPNSITARNGRGITNRALKRYEAALADFDELIRLHPNYAAARYNRALVNIDLQKPEDAVRDFTGAIDVDKEFAGAYAQRGLLHEKAGDRDKAIADFRAALAAPAKFDSGPWAHRTARQRLQALGVVTP